MNTIELRTLTSSYDTLTAILVLTWVTILIHVFNHITRICISFALQGFLEDRALGVPAVDPGRDYLDNMALQQRSGLRWYGTTSFGVRFKLGLQGFG